MNDDDTSSSTTETFIISPNGRFKLKMKSWMRGVLLGSGSFGSVYEGISEDGIFFAVKEMSLLDKGCNAQQCIIQLEQEILLLSLFEHENIVQYYGTDERCQMRKYIGSCEWLCEACRFWIGKGDDQVQHAEISQRKCILYGSRGC